MSGIKGLRPVTGFYPNLIKVFRAISLPESSCSPKETLRLDLKYVWVPREHVG